MVPKAFGTDSLTMLAHVRASPDVAPPKRLRGGAVRAFSLPCRQAGFSANITVNHSRIAGQALQLANRLYQLADKGLSPIGRQRLADGDASSAAKGLPTATPLENLYTSFVAPKNKFEFLTFF